MDSRCPNVSTGKLGDDLFQGSALARSRQSVDYQVSGSHHHVLAYRFDVLGCLRQYSSGSYSDVHLFRDCFVECKNQYAFYITTHGNLLSALVFVLGFWMPVGSAHCFPDCTFIVTSINWMSKQIPKNFQNLCTLHFINACSVAEFGISQVEMVLFAGTLGDL